MALSDLVVRMAADTATFQADMGKAVQIAERESKRIEGAFANLKKAGAAAFATISVGALVGEFRRLTDEMAKIDDQLQKGFGDAQGLSRFQQILKITGKSVSDLDAPMRGLIKLFNTAESESGRNSIALTNAKNAATALGLSWEDLKKQSPTQAIETLAKAFAQFPDDANKSAVAMGLFKDAGPEVITFLNDLIKYGDIAGKVTKEQAEAASNFRNELRRFSNESDNFKQAILSNLIPPMTDFMFEMRTAINLSGGFLQALFDIGAGAISLKSASDRLKEINAELAQVKKSQAEGGFFRELFFDDAARIRRLERQRSVAEVFKREQDKRDLPSFADVRGGVVGRTLEGFRLNERPARASGGGARTQELIDLAEQERRIVRAQQESLIAIDRDINRARLEALEAYHRSGILSDENYYKLRRELARQSFDEELRDIQGLIQNQQRAQADAAAKLAQAQKAGDVSGINSATRKEFDAKVELIKLDTRRQQLELKFAEENRRVTAEREEQLKTSQSVITQINAQVYEFLGNTARAAELRFDDQNRQRRDSIIANFGAGSSEARAFDQLRGLTIAQAQFNNEKEKLSLLQGQLSSEEERIQNSIRSGAIGELEALQKTSDARKRQLDVMNAQVLALEAIARASQNPTLILQAEQARIALERLRNESDLLAQKFESIFTDAFSDAFSDFITGAKSAKDAIKSFGDAVVREINGIIAKQLGQQLARSLGLSGNASGAGGGGGFFGFLASMFGGGGAAGAGAAGAGAAAGASDVFGVTLAAIAHSGRGPGDSETVRPVPSVAFADAPRFHAGIGANERAAVILKSESVLTRGQMQQLAPLSSVRDAVSINTARPGLTSGVSVSNTFNIAGPVDRRTMQQIAASAAQSLQTASRNL